MELEKKQKCTVCYSDLEEYQNQYICSNCGKLYSKDITPNDISNTDDNANSSSAYLTEHKLKPTFKIIISWLLTIALFITIICVFSGMAKQRKIKNGYIQTAQSAFNDIKSDINNELYGDAIRAMKTYNDRYTSDDKYYKNLPEEIKPSVAIPQLKKEIFDYISERSSVLYEKINSVETLTYSSHYEDLKKLENYFQTLSSYSNYLTDGKSTAANIETFKEKNYKCKYKKALVLYNYGEKTEAINILKNLYGYDNVSPQLKLVVSTTLNNFIASNKATNFEIIGGSKEVYVYKSGKNFAWKCPHCGYFSDGVGTMSIYSELGSHYAGEVSTTKGMMSCAGRWVGGCGRLSTYSLTIKYK